MLPQGKTYKKMWKIPPFPGELRRATASYLGQDDGVFADSQTILVAVVDGRGGAADIGVTSSRLQPHQLVTFGKR